MLLSPICSSYGRPEGLSRAKSTPRLRSRDGRAQTAPLAHAAGHDIDYIAMSGVLSRHGICRPSVRECDCRLGCRVKPEMTHEPKKVIKNGVFMWAAHWPRDRCATLPRCLA